MNIDRNPDSHILIPFTGMFNRKPFFNDIVNKTPDIYALIYHPTVIKWLAEDFENHQMTPDDFFMSTYNQFPFALQAPRDPSVIPLHMRQMLFEAKYDGKKLEEIYRKRNKKYT